MRDSLTVLSHSTNPLAKTWKADGTIAPYSDGKYFTTKHLSLDSLQDLSKILTKLERRPKSCVIRGTYVGDEKAKDLDLEYNVGKVRRILDVHEDKPHHWVLVEVDNFEPLASDPLADPVSSINEYVYHALPPCFHDVSYHWQLSNSAGSAKHAGKLKAHVWFWLARAYTSEELRQWAMAYEIDLDRSVLNSVQVHYTSAPIFDEGVTDPVPVRSGFVDGIIGDEVNLVIDDAILSAVSSGSGKSKVERLKQIATSDARARMLYDRGMVKSVGRQGELRITCPRESEHSGDSGESSTVYYLPNTGGYATGHFVCKHAHCSGVPQGLFDLALGYDDFDILGEAHEIEVDRIKKRVKGNSKSEIAELLSSNFPTTDQANAVRLRKAFAGQVVYSSGRPYAWTGSYWSNDVGQAYILATRLSSIIIKEAEACIGEAKKHSGEKREAYEKQAKLLYKWAQQSEMKGTFEAAMSIVSKMLDVPASKFNSNPYLINAANGTIDVRTKEVKSHDKNDYITNMISRSYIPSLRSETFTNVLLQVCCEDDEYLVNGEAKLANFLMRLFGYCMTGLVREQVMGICYGGGRNGKSTIIDAVMSAMGDTAGTSAPGLLMGNGKDRHPTEIADLYGKRLVVAHETAEGAALNEAFVKQATGGDKLKARYMRGDFFEWLATHKILMLTNHKPVVKSQDEGIWRRLLVIPFLAKFGTHEELEAGLATHIRDLSVPERLAQDGEAIFSMLVDAAHEYCLNGLNPPDCVRLASLQYKEAQDRMKNFIEECCEVDSQARIPLSGEFGALYPAYQAWCKESGFMALGKIKVLDEIFRVMPQLTKNPGKQNRKDGGRNKVTWINGLKLVNDV